MSEIKNIYPDEQEKIEDEFKWKLELSFKIEELLTRYGYQMVANMGKNGPYVDFVKDDSTEMPLTGSGCSSSGSKV